MGAKQGAVEEETRATRAGAGRGGNDDTAERASRRTSLCCAAPLPLLAVVAYSLNSHARSDTAAPTSSLQRGRAAQAAEGRQADGD
mmetsp:Transcript_37550/g.94198  ORF Transcript_37550/g.94198 Transcript_37550/m.94198 type:complete len:86 (+) Transcript_37550:170-427(+)